MIPRKLMILDHPSLSVHSGTYAGKYRQMVVVKLDHHCGIVYCYPHEVVPDDLPSWLPAWLRRWFYRLRKRGVRHVNA